MHRYVARREIEEDLLVVALLVALALVAAVLHAAISAAQVLEEDEVGDVERSVEHDGARVEVDALVQRHALQVVEPPLFGKLMGSPTRAAGALP